MTVLPDLIPPHPVVLFCGTAAGERSAARGHYYAGPGNDFWHLLHEAGFTPARLMPEHDARVTEFGIGLTDLAKNVSQSSDRGLRKDYDVKGFVGRVEQAAPEWVAFHGKEAAKAVSSRLGHGRNVKLGRQNWSIGQSPVFVLPSGSGANRDPKRLEGRGSRLEWFAELHRLTRNTLRAADR